MKREDFYIQEATKYSQSEILNVEALAFIAGMKKADSYPNWIKVTDRMPELIDHCLCSVYVLITYKVQYEYVGEVRYTFCVPILLTVTFMLAAKKSFSSCSSPQTAPNP